MSDENSSRHDSSLQRAGERFAQELESRFEQAAQDRLQCRPATDLHQTHIQGESNG